MNRVVDILKKTLQRRKAFLLLIALLPLCACDDSCPTIQDYKNDGIGVDGEDCTLCLLFTTLSAVALSCANRAWAILTTPLIPIVGITGAIYVAIFTLKLVGSFGKQTAPDYLTGDKKGVCILLFKMAIIIYLLNESVYDSFIINSFIYPILKGGLEIGAELSLSDAEIYTSIEDIGWNSLFIMIKDAARNFNLAMYDMIAIGEAMICNATLGFIFSWYWLMLLYGIILFLFGWLLLVAVSFFMIDLIVRLSIGAILLPLGIACAISKQTVGYSKNIWNIFLNVFFSFIMLGIIVGLSVELVLLTIGVSSEEEGSRFGSPALSAFLTDFDAMIDKNQIKMISEELWSNGNLLLTIICFSIAAKLVQQIGTLAGEISDTAGFAAIAPASQAAAPFVQKATQGVEKIGSYAGSVALSGAKYSGHVAARVTRADKLYRWSGRKAEAMRGFFTGSGRQGYNAMWHKQTWNKIGSEISQFSRESSKDKLRHLWRWLR